MRSRTAITIGIPLLLLLLLSGCAQARERLDTLTNITFACNVQCTGSYPHTVGAMENGSCVCRCDGNYKSYGGACVDQKQYEALAASECDSRCASSVPNSKGSFKGGKCTCACGKGYLPYNNSCYSRNGIEALSPILCAEDYPVLKYYAWSYNRSDSYIYLCYARDNATFDTRRYGRSDYWNFVNDPGSNESVSLLTQLLLNISGKSGLDRYRQAEFAIAFVQSLPYTYDNVSTPYDDYPRFPSETIYADGGDCEDTAILMAAVLRKMGQDVVLLRLPHHVAAGVACNPSDFAYNATAFPYNGQEYCFLETTGEGFKIGELPSAYSPTDVTVVPMRESAPDLYIRGNYTYSSSSHSGGYTFIDVKGIHIDNYGTEEAKNVIVTVSLEGPQPGETIDSYSYTIGKMPAATYYDYGIQNLRVQDWGRFRVLISVHGDNFREVESNTDWASWH